MNTSEYDQQQSWLPKFENPSQLHLSTLRVYPCPPSQAPCFSNSQLLEGRTYDFRGDDIERDDRVRPWIISEASTESSTFLSYDTPFSQTPVLWENHVNSATQLDGDSVSKRFNPQAASFQPRQPSSGQEITQTQLLIATPVNADG